MLKNTGYLLSRNGDNPTPAPNALESGAPQLSDGWYPCLTMLRVPQNPVRILWDFDNMFFLLKLKEVWQTFLIRCQEPRSEGW